MTYQRERYSDPNARCLRHGCDKPVAWRVATTRWWKLHDKNANDGRTGIVFEMCEDHVGAGCKIRKPEQPK